MYQIQKTFHFEAGHSLKHHRGLCKNPHGHRYTFTLHLNFETLHPSAPSKNMGLDFQDLSTIVDPIIKTYLDHQWLNDTLNTDSPTAEFIASWLFSTLTEALPNLVGVTVEETASCRVSFFP